MTQMASELPEKGRRGFRDGKQSSSKRGDSTGNWPITGALIALGLVGAVILFFVVRGTRDKVKKDDQARADAAPPRDKIEKEIDDEKKEDKKPPKEEKKPFSWPKLYEP